MVVSFKVMHSATFQHGELSDLTHLVDSLFLEFQPFPVQAGVAHLE